MKPEFLEYLSSQLTCVIALEMPDGSPHASTVHFAHSAEPFQFIFLTERSYRKGKALLEKKEIRASVVVGTQSDAIITFQLDGIASLTEDPTLIKTYYEKFKEKNQADLDENDIFFTFTPTWWRFTDWTKPEGKTIFTSTQL